MERLTRQLQARRLATGELLWSWTAPQASTPSPGLNLIITDNLAFLSTSANTFAVDLATHQSVWSTPVNGKLALSSNAVLYISFADRVTAFALK